MSNNDVRPEIYIYGIYIPISISSCNLNKSNKSVGILIWNHAAPSGAHIRNLRSIGLRSSVADSKHDIILHYSHRFSRVRPCHAPHLVKTQEIKNIKLLQLLVTLSLFANLNECH